MSAVEFPAMRREVARALASLADLEYQRRTWLVVDPGVSAEENLTLFVHILYDDTQVLPDPATRIGSVLVDSDEIGALRALSEPLDELLDRLGEAPDVDYLASSEWPAIVQLAGVALAAVVRAGNL